MIEKKKQLSEKAYLKTYVIEKSEYVQSGNSNNWQPEKRPAIIVLPGGGYKYIADSEDEPVVFHFLSKGYSVFSLHYSVGDESEYPAPLIEVFESIKYARDNAKNFGIDENAIVLCGFSAGAHLAGLASTQCETEEIVNIFGRNAELIKPNATILCYPITNVTRLRRENLNRVLSWGKMLSVNNEKVDVIRYVSEKMCPVFLWHTRTDGIVPVSQTIDLISAMEKNNVKFECHIFGAGYHGLSTNDVLSNYRGAIQNGEMVPNVKEWINLASEWINYLFHY